MNTLLASLEFIKAPAPGNNKELGDVGSVVSKTLEQVRQRGDDAVREYSRTFDKFSGQALEVTLPERLAALAALDAQTRADIEFAIARVTAFAKAQLGTMRRLKLKSLKAFT